jgi:two-component system chemotaxis sensor kinase CheA
MAMDFEMAEILKVFFEESAEGINAMESGLLSLEAGADREQINTIFRAAHSIKGGAGTFGFMEISEFTHSVETLLDQMRNGGRGISSEVVQVLLQSVDVMRDMLDLAQAEKPIASEHARAVSAQLARILESAPAPAPAAAAAPLGVPAPAAIAAAPTPAIEAPVAPVAPTAPVAPVARIGHWRVRFLPHPTLFETCNDPLRIFRQLEPLGVVRVVADTASVPPLAELDPTQCYLSWTLEIEGAIEQSQIAEIFDWVDANSSITYERIEPNGASAEPVGLPAPKAVEPSVVELSAAAPSPVAVPTVIAPTVIAPAVAASAVAAPSVAAPSVAAPSGAAPTGAAPAIAAPAIATPTSAAPNSARQGTESSSIRVATEKVDALINLVGELVITQSMLGRFSDGFEAGEVESLRRCLGNLARNTRELQESVLKIRMLPISFSFNRFPRLVHELSRKLGKRVDLRLSGESTELDKTVLEKIGDPLVHLVRNSLDHGLEGPEARVAAGKDEIGILELNAYHEGGNVIIEVKDDGAGLNQAKILAKARERGLVGADASLSDEQIYNLIFLPGFSTAEAVSDVSGRGVGMDVVRRNITDLGGHVQISSTPGQGSTIRIRLPLTLAILEGQMLRVGRETYVVSLVSMIETVQPKSEHIFTVGGRNELFKHRDEYLPVIRLHEMFQIEPDSRDIARGLLVVAESDGRRVALLADELLVQQQVVIKSLDVNFKQVPGLAGATINGDGSVALILDVPGLISKFLGLAAAAQDRAA